MTTENWYTYSGATGLEVGAHNSPDPGDIVCSPPPGFAQDSLRHWPRRARLIAAAPDLYRALELIQKWDAPPYALNWQDDVKPAVEAALAKARPAEGVTPDPAANIANDVPEPAKRKWRVVGADFDRIFEAEEISEFGGELSFATGKRHVGRVPQYLFWAEVNA